MNDAELALLVDRWSDGDLPPAERESLSQRLQDDEEFARAFVAEARFRGQLGGLLAERDGEELWLRVDAVVRATTETGRHRFADRVEARLAQRARPSARSRRAAPRRAAWWQMAVAVAAMVAVALSLWLYRPTAHEPDTTTPPVVVAPVARLSSCSGTVTLDDATVQSGATIARGQRLRVDADGSATIAYDDGTGISPAPGSTVTVDLEDGAKRLRLDRGSLTATVAKQPTGKPLRLTTPNAVAIVVGTRFTLATDGAGSDLAVSEGRVAFAPASGGEAVEVAAGESARVDAGVVAKRVAPGPEHQRLMSALSMIVPQTAEQRWSTLDWAVDLWDARRRAGVSGKPVLLWTGWGDPFGMADSETLADRAAVWSDAEVLRLADERFVLGAVDTWWLTKRTDAAGRFFAALAGHLDHRSTTYDGLFCFTADGTFVGFLAAGQPPGEVRTQLATWAARASTAVTAVPDEGPLDHRHRPQLPPEALRLEVSARELTREGDSWRGAGGAARDHLWLSSSEWRQLLPANAHPGQRIAMPEAVARKIARFDFVDCTRGEAAMWEDDDVRALDLAMIVEEATPQRLTLRVEGSARLGGDRRGYAPAIAGRIAADDGHITTFELVAIGERWGGDGDTPAPPRSTLGIAVRIAGDAAWNTVPPHGLRDASYFAPDR